MLLYSSLNYLTIFSEASIGTRPWLASALPLVPAQFQNSSSYICDDMPILPLVNWLQLPNLIPMSNTV